MLSAISGYGYEHKFSANGGWIRSRRPTGLMYMTGHPEAKPSRRRIGGRRAGRHACRHGDPGRAARPRDAGAPGRDGSMALFDVAIDHRLHPSGAAADRQGFRRAPATSRSSCAPTGVSLQRRRRDDGAGNDRLFGKLCAAMGWMTCRPSPRLHDERASPCRRRRSFPKKHSEARFPHQHARALGAQCAAPACPAAACAPRPRRWPRRRRRRATWCRQIDSHRRRRDPDGGLAAETVGDAGAPGLACALAWRAHARRAGAAARAGAA